MFVTGCLTKFGAKSSRIRKGATTKKNAAGGRKYWADKPSSFQSLWIWNVCSGNIFIKEQPGMELRQAQFSFSLASYFCCDCLLYSTTLGAAGGWNDKSRYLIKKNLSWGWPGLGNGCMLYGFSLVEANVTSWSLYVAKRILGWQTLSLVTWENNFMGIWIVEILI